ncbi:MULTISPECIES: TetR family transcriptional regulator C-terminal domain-containing protein [unclassified Leisingera]|uniref:TetR family transcriptional regulator C-terminal domain-containing protein n=1 Tax=unclassified Leisingera TaxID=2614906 RepID=UPI00030BB439|nr:MULTISPECIES: TetR family transcriptional regulator C-terminal domain-containing protein [unclassified Leisingera]KIC15790.1 TetR family transcriptional regulator [Leisingera sp. ANG-DT]KIC23745.1 TetR family transcriptional regulator [Leisingera sp. ANG-S3]KIC50651.1 TetR family transcriptional regulator [Leisingera sp. ANG-S]KID09884.1 TetR family transcriptional regulator [Leisingera sp. ANG1]
MARMASEKPKTKIQRQKTEQIMAAALEVFSRHGSSGASINMIAKTAGLTTPNLLYYFESKDAIRRELMGRTLQLWMAPLSMLSPHGEPIDEICEYIRRKLDVSRSFPKESKFFANEVLSGLPRSRSEIFGPLKELYSAKILLLEEWMNDGKIASVDPHHLLFSIWATTQHYADFDVQIAEIAPSKAEDRYVEAEAFLLEMYKKLLAV